MAGQQGRDLLLKLGDAASPEVFTTIAGVTTKGFSFANGTVDITTDDEDGVRTLLAGKYGMAGTATVSGIAKDDATWGTIRTNFLAGTFHNYQFVIPGSTSNGTYSFTAACTSFEETGETDGAMAFSATFESTGAITFA